MDFLYISFFFPPLAGAEPRHNLSVIRSLCAKNFTPTIVTAPENTPYPRDTSLEQLIPGQIKIARFTWPYNSNKYILKLREVARVPPNPLVFRGSRYIYKTAKRLINDGNYKFLYSLHGIGGAHLAALRLKEETGIPWVAEFRDSWIYNGLIWKYMEDKSWKMWYAYQLRKTRRLLKKVVGNADLIVVESPMHGEFLVKDFGIGRDKVVPYGIGYDEDYFSLSKQGERKLIRFIQRPVIVFVGSIYYGYEDAVESLILALRDLESKGHIFSLISVGNSSSVFSRYAGKSGLKSFLPIDRVNLDTALYLMKESDFGIVMVLKGYKANINSKLWEYLRANLSILAVVPKDGAMSDLISEGKCGYILPYDKDGMVSVLETALNDWEQETALRPDPEFVARFSQSCIADKLADRLEDMIRRENR